MVEAVFFHLLPPYLVTNGERRGKERAVRALTASCENLLLDFFYVRLPRPNAFGDSVVLLYWVIWVIGFRLFDGSLCLHVQSPSWPTLYIFARCRNYVPGTCVPFKMKGHCFFETSVTNYPHGVISQKKVTFDLPPCLPVRIPSSWS